MEKKRRKIEYFGNETKKEFIIRVAKEDPFLKIEEIAEMAGTTPHYVRTILSDANLSLMNLRKEYARRMEKYSESKILLSIKDSVSRLNIHTEENASVFTYSVPYRNLIESSEDFLWNIDKKRLYRYMQYIYYCQKPVGIIDFITQIRLPDEKLKQKDFIFKLSGLNLEEIRLTSPEIEIGKLSNLLKLNPIDSEFSPDHIVIKIRTLLTIKDQILGEEIFFFSSDYIKLIIPGLFSPTLELAQDS
ncbi:hypothetical protein BBF96_10060 [Anoxybacter fermentans]|uniref:UbiC transcription regulator-associated domain-containing protein n=1 Tax=Anoxybacter fermentans TaxID=1323375 RepID=A0A3Q9HQT2_9FIRM|nr:hypothetical protein [Anoxybacter fermentans]AZR73696.1 hypothetical protein BBF96_10060 [Anoxybacter fermentans]